MVPWEIREAKMDAILGFIVFLLLVITGRSLWRREFKAAALSFSAIIGLAVADNVLQLTEPMTQSAEIVTKTATSASVLTSLPA